MSKLDSFKKSVRKVFSEDAVRGAGLWILFFFGFFFLISSIFFEGVEKYLFLGVGLMNFIFCFRKSKEFVFFGMFLFLLVGCSPSFPSEIGVSAGIPTSFDRCMDLCFDIEESKFLDRVRGGFEGQYIYYEQYNSYDGCYYSELLDYCHEKIIFYEGNVSYLNYDRCKNSLRNFCNGLSPYPESFEEICFDKCRLVS